MVPLFEARIQYARLLRHIQIARQTWDVIASRDLSHVLRVWVDMRQDAHTLAEARGMTPRFTHYEKTKHFRALVRGTTYTYLPLASGVPGPAGIVNDLVFTDRALTDEEIALDATRENIVVRPSDMTLSEWLGSEVIVRQRVREDGFIERVGINRDILVKRMANAAGGSHPIGADDAEDQDNQFDPHIHTLHSLLVGGIPATFYQLLEIAVDLMSALGPAFDTTEQARKAAEARQGTSDGPA